ncbi:MAG: phage tail protein [Bacteroidales bacterium]|jgi:hypothetical protein|nr:phage tail protein [Bacteroidales bacterium]
MEQIIIKHADGTNSLLNSGPRTSGITKAEQSVGLLAEDTVAITVKSASPLEFALGDTIEVYGKIYTLNQLPTIKKTGVRKFEYSLTFEGVQYELIDAQFLLPDDTVGDSFTGNLFDFLKIVIANALRVFPNKWVLGEYPEETEYKTLTFSGRNCLEVLQDLCNEYNQEFEITQNNGVRTLHIRNAGVEFPYTFRYGKTGGLYELTRQNINSKNVVTRLYIYGGSNNLGNSYRHTKLCLPGSSGKNDSYIENAAAIAAFGLKENTKTFDNIFPNRYGEVTGLGSKYYAFIDNTMNFDLNETFANTTEDYQYWLASKRLDDTQENRYIYYNDVAGKTTKWLIYNVDAKVHFTTGNLAGYEFDVHSYNHATKEIQLKPYEDENKMHLPSEYSAAFQFSPEDKYFFTDINLPDQYKTEAEAKLQEEGEAYYAQNSQPQVQYGLNIDQNFIKQFAGNLTVVNLFAVGDYIPIEDEDIGVDKSIRITGFKRDLLEPYKYSLTLGDSVTKGAYTRIISDLREIDEVIKINNLADPSKARRNWRASQEVLAMVFDPEGDYYSEKIKPLSIETTMLQAGAKSMQFVLRNVVFEPNYQSNPNYIRVSAGQLIHYTIEETIRNWEIAQVTFSNLVSNTAYYIYARCSMNTGGGSIILDTTQRKVDYETGYYTFMIGVLNSVETDSNGQNPARLVSLTYGSSTINGRFIKTGRIESSGGGSTYFDLDNGEIGGNIKFLSNGNLTTFDELKIGGENLLQIENTDLFSIAATSYLNGLLADNMPIGKYVFSYRNLTKSQTSFAVSLRIRGRNTSGGISGTLIAIDLDINMTKEYLINLTNYTAYSSFIFYIYTSSASNTATFTNVILQEGTKSTQYQKALGYISDAIKNGSTTVAGGLVLSNIVMVKDGNGTVTGGLTGIDDALLWGGGSYNSLIDNNAPLMIYKKNMPIPNLGLNNYIIERPQVEVPNSTTFTNVSDEKNLTINSSYNFNLIVVTNESFWYATFPQSFSIIPAGHTIRIEILLNNSTGQTIRSYTLSFATGESINKYSTLNGEIQFTNIPLGNYTLKSRVVCQREAGASNVITEIQSYVQYCSVIYLENVRNIKLAPNYMFMSNSNANKILIASESDNYLVNALGNSIFRSNSGRYQLKIDDTGIKVSSDFGRTWRNL